MIYYNDFLLERKIELILESKLFLSKKLHELISGINMPLAKSIIDLSNIDIDTQYNYIDLSKEEDIVTFISDRKAKEIIDNSKNEFIVRIGSRYLTRNPSNKYIYNALGFEIPASDNEQYRPESGTIGVILSEMVSKLSRTYCLFECSEGVDKGRKTIINKEALSPTDEGTQTKLWTSNRNPIKIGRLIKAIARVANIKTTDKEIEEFVNQYKSHISIINDAFKKFDVVSEKQISHFYSRENYHGDGHGTLGNSCMADSPASTFDIYTKNPDVCQLVILYNDKGTIKDGKYTSDKIIGRALLWKNSDTEYYMDRIYTNNDSDVELFKQYAQRNNWWYKKRQDSNWDAVFSNGNSEKRASLIFKLNNWGDDFPYLDTFCFFNSENGNITNDKKATFVNYQLSETDGGHHEMDDDDY